MLGWQRFAIVGETLSEQLQNLSRQTQGMQQAAIDFACMRLLKGNEEVERYLRELYASFFFNVSCLDLVRIFSLFILRPLCSGLSLNYVVSKVEKKHNDERIFESVPIEKQPFNFFREYELN